MDLVTLNGDQAVTTSLAIAEGTENDHASVIKLVRTYLTDLEEFGSVAFETRSQARGNSGFEIQNGEGADLKSHPSGAGRPTEYANLNEQQATLILTYMRNSDAVRGFKKRLVHAFFQMAQQLAVQKFNVPTTYPEAMRLAADLADKNAAQAALIQEQAPKVAALDRFASHDGKHNTRSAAKLLGIREKVFIPWLIGHDWYYRDHGGRLCAKSGRLGDGCLDTVPVEIQRSDGIQTVPQPVITQKGLAKLAVLLARDGLLPKLEVAA